MSNPAPTLNQINAFNATQGTTIDFNIIGGTEVIRSNKIYIYDLSDNSLICTHLYVSTESIHELPANTDSSIVYESGKSSADFVNGVQYYAQIQTYTDTAGTQGGSGLSVAKMFWCLVDPTLTITTIPSTISTTSYNVSATYDANTSAVSNIIQQYQFNLYSAVGSLLQSSGVVVGSGEQQGTSTAYDISYNFTGLSVGNSYYVVVDVTTTQGMNISVQSGIFTVSIDTPTLGEATVVNNACDGYISVTSNLSGEYGGSASGEIASFVTSSINDISSLKVNIDPVQDLHGYDKPWVGGAGKNKFNPNNVIDNSYLSVNGAVMSNTPGWVISDFISVSPNTEYTFTPNSTEGNAAKSWFYDADKTPISYIASGAITFTTPANCAYMRFSFRSTSTDVQLEIGSTATAYEPYENICPITGWTGCEVDVAGVNLLDDSLIEQGGYDAVSTQNCVTSYLPVKGGQTFMWSQSGSVNGRYVRFYDGAHNEQDSATRVTQYNATNATFTSPQWAKYMRVMWYSASNITPADIKALKPQIEVGSTATPYKAYNGTTYPVSWQTEAGTVYGGTVDLVSGVLTVNRVERIFNGSETWSYSEQAGTGKRRVYTSITGAKPVSNNIFADILEPSPNTSSAYPDEGTCYVNTTPALMIGVGDSITSANDWKTLLSNANLQLVYELATPQTYQLDPVQVQTLIGQNNVWSDAGDVEITYNIPITNLLVKRQDVADVSGVWLTLYSQPITQASDMDFTFIDFLNQYGKTYKYALVPLLTQTQSGVVVQIEGGYTVSDNVDSIFDGVYIADQTNVERVKAGAGYGNIDMNQGVGSITPIGSKYPIVITNSQNQYHNGSVRGTIVPNDFYSNGNLSRIDMVNKRDELEQFLTNKRAKIIKDWNGNMWLVMIMSNVNCSFDDNYGMGMVSFSADWLEVGDPTNQQDLYNAGLINVGGV